MNRVVAVFAVTLGLVLGVVPWLQANEPAVPAADAGYFLDWSQRGDLLWTGTMEDSIGNVYDVKVCPGYVPMAKMVTRHWGGAGRSFGEYGKKRTYHDLGRVSGDVLKWSTRDCLWRWGVRGAGQAWGKHFHRANQSVSRRAFGWVLAYPFALCTATIESSFRLVTGVPVGLGGDVIGVTVVPAVGVAWPTVKGVAEVAVPGTVLPVAGTAWNSVGTPVLALTGQRPAPHRIDGFFVTMKPKALPPLTPEAAAGLIRAAVELNPVVAEIAKRREQARTDGLAQLDALQKALAAQSKTIKQTMAARDTELRREQEARIRALLAAKPQSKATLVRLFQEGKLNPAFISIGDAAIALQGTGLTHDDLLRICLLLAEPAADAPPKRDAAGRPEPFWLQEDAPAGGVQATGKPN